MWRGPGGFEDQSHLQAAINYPLASPTPDYADEGSGRTHQSAGEGGGCAGPTCVSPAPGTPGTPSHPRGEHAAAAALCAWGRPRQSLERGLLCVRAVTRLINPLIGVSSADKDVGAGTPGRSQPTTSQCLPEGPRCCCGEHQPLVGTHSHVPSPVEGGSEPSAQGAGSTHGPFTGRCTARSQPRQAPAPRGRRLQACVTAPAYTTARELKPRRSRRR